MNLSPAFGHLAAALPAGAALTPAAQAAAPADDRVTMSAWFVREQREVAAEVWKRPAVGSACNGAACHTAAAESRFSERDARIPK